MSKFADQITGNDGKLYFAGVSSVFSEVARKKGFSVKAVRLTGHHIYATVHIFAHWNGGALIHGTPMIDGIPSSSLPIATNEEKDEFFNNL